VVSLYAHLVQPVLDAQARREISRSAAESTLMIAVSPLALVDMAFIAWRNLRLINRIATLYGIELGYYSRLRLFRLVLLNIAFAGASELVREVGWTGCRRIWRPAFGACGAGHWRRVIDGASGD
jgi:putative membrane protein